MNRFLLIVLLAAVSAGTVFSHHDAGRQPPAQTQTLPTSPKTGKGTGVVQQINREKGVITIKHGPLQGIVIPAMTMSFLVKDKSMLSDLKPLQKVDFELTHENGIYVITKIR
jgi:Cu(I)/Ag(I) efflux system protein CusF